MEQRGRQERRTALILRFGGAPILAQSFLSLFEGLAFFERLPSPAARVLFAVKARQTLPESQVTADDGARTLACIALRRLGRR